jgi:hypothetical protein
VGENLAVATASRVQNMDKCKGEGEGVLVVTFNWLRHGSMGSSPMMASAVAQAEQGRQRESSA